ncbi:DsbA family protein [Brevibacillus ginsengisoli]|uniref:DsbA family protein n=1 Tax=Brevibacillus ginsengisoli TaxID=363854 RepID=UPI003CF6BC41
MVLKKKQKQQKNKMQSLVWATIAVVAIILVAVIVLDTPKPPSTTAPASFAYDQLPVLGNPKAPVKIVEFADFKCPVCQHFSQKIKTQLQKDYIDKGTVAFYYMNLPIIGPDSFTAAYAAQSVYHQKPEAFWTYYETLFNNQQDEKKNWATPEFLTELAQVKSLPINYDQLKQDIDSKKYKAEVDEQAAIAEKLGVSGTPTLFINGQRVKEEDTFNYEALKAIIEKVQKNEK